MNKNMLFIVGSGRSGTSLLQSMFAAHPEVACLPETGFIRRRVFPGHLQSIYQHHGEQAVKEDLAIDDYFIRTGLDASSVVTRAVARKGQLDAAVYKEMLISYSYMGIFWVGDKDPRAVEFFRLLDAVLPNAHVIHVFRDPRDVLASKKEAGWSRTGHVWKHIFANRVQFNLGQRNGPIVFGKNYHEIAYEELIATPDAVLSDLCRKIGLRFDVKMLSFGDAARRLVSKKEVGWKKETFGPLLTNNKGKWLSALTPREIRLCELCCSDVMVSGKYKRDKRKHRYCMRDQLWIFVGAIIIKLATYPYLVYRYYTEVRICRRLR